MYIKEKMKQLGFEKPSPIQQGVFDQFSSRNHLVGLAPTGTGKTHAYLLPILEKLNTNQKEVQAVFVVPTNELVYQLERMLKVCDASFIVRAYVGGSDKKRESEWLMKHQPHVVIATPERLLDFVVERNILKIHTAKYLVLDEADMMFDEAFLSMIDPWLSALKDAKFMLFSASITPSMEPFIQKYFGHYDLIDTTKNHQLSIGYPLIQIQYRNRLDALIEIMRSLNPYLCFVFVSKKDDQQLVYDRVIEEGFNAVNLNAGIGVKKRAKIIEDILAMRYVYVITSDLSARGLDFKISHVIHYDLPYHLEFFKHRSGRTGRMYDDGLAITLMSPSDQSKIDRLRRQGIPFVIHQLGPNGLVPIAIKKKERSQDELDVIKKIKKPTRVKPNYKKKYKQEVDKAMKSARRKRYANPR